MFNIDVKQEQPYVLMAHNDRMFSIEIGFPGDDRYGYVYRKCMRNMIYERMFASKNGE